MALSRRSVLLSIPAYSIAGLPAFAQRARAPVAPADLPPKPGKSRTLMAQRGKALFQETFTETDLKRNWRHIFGHWTIANGQIKAVENPADNHHGEIWRTAEMKDVIVQFSFRFNGATMLGMGFEHTDPKGNDHLFRSTVHPDQFYMMQGSGWSGTTKFNRVASVLKKFTPGQWYTMVVEIVGREMLSHIDEKCFLFGEAEGIDTPKNQLSLQIKGDSGSYANVGIWEAIPDKTWLAKKGEVLDRVKKQRDCD